jgi:hypothetical protein
MPPRKSVASATPADTTSKPRQSLKRKSISTTALEQVEALLPSSCTPGYTAPVHTEDSSSGSTRRKSVKGKGKEVEGEDGKLTEEQKAALLVEVSLGFHTVYVHIPISSRLQILGFQPTELLQDITESARQQVDKTVLTIENWLSKVVRLSANSGAKGKVLESQQGELMLEVDQVRNSRFSDRYDC